MKVYMLIPLNNTKDVKIRERAHRVVRSTLTSDYAEYFGKANEYYVDWTAQAYKISSWKTVSYQHDCGTWYYTALNPQDVIGKRMIKQGG